MSKLYYHTDIGGFQRILEEGKLPVLNDVQERKIRRMSLNLYTPQEWETWRQGEKVVVGFRWEKSYKHITERTGIVEVDEEPCLEIMVEVHALKEKAMHIKNLLHINQAGRYENVPVHSFY